MALNFSHRPIFPVHTSEDSLVSPLRIVNGGYVVEGMSERGCEGFVKPRHGNGELLDRFEYGRDKGDKGGSPDTVSKDIIDLLPSDPFGMDIDISTTFTALTGWLGDLEADYGGYMKNNMASAREESGLFAGFNLIWNSAMRFQSLPSNVVCHDIACAVDQCMYGCGFGDASSQIIRHAHNVDDMLPLDHVCTSALVKKCEESRQCLNAAGGDHHQVFDFVLGYLGIKDLLSMERVCRSLCSTIRNDSLLWRNIHIGQPLNERITDEILVQLTSRAGGSLECLTLIKCPRITDDGLKQVLWSNPKLTKLSIPGCTRLSIEGILNNLKAFMSNNGAGGIKYIRLGGYYGLTHKHYEELKYLLGVGGHVQRDIYKPHYYCRGDSSLLCDDDRAIDVEVCPRCQNLRLLYDCPAEGCQVKDQGVNLCRACFICIPRCAECGRCVHNSEFVENFALENVCSECVIASRRYEEMEEMEVDVRGGSRDGLCLHG